MFRLQDNVPQVYVEQSRDFQMFCRLVDIIQNSTKFDIDSVIHILEPFLSNDVMLELLCTKIGFFPKQHYDAEILRYIIAAFPYAVKNKGSVEGVEAIVNAIIRAENVTSTDYDNIGYVFIERDDTGGITVDIYANYDIKNRNALNDVFSYILPAGCSVNYSVYTVRALEELKITPSDSTRRVFPEGTRYSKVDQESTVKAYLYGYVLASEDVKLYQGAPITSQVVGSDDLVSLREE